MTTTLTTDASTEEEAPVLLAVSYLRVSTREQAERGGKGDRNPKGKPGGRGDGLAQRNGFHGGH